MIKTISDISTTHFTTIHQNDVTTFYNIFKDYTHTQYFHIRVLMVKIVKEKKIFLFSIARTFHAKICRIFIYYLRCGAVCFFFQTRREIVLFGSCIVQKPEFFVLGFLYSLSLYTFRIFFFCRLLL